MSPSAPPSASPAVVERARSGWPAWRAARLAAVTAPTGNLALTETRWPAPGEPAARPPGGLPGGVTVTTLQRRHLTTGAVEHGLRVWDPHSPAIAHFETIEAFPFDPAWVVEARFTAAAEPRLVPFEHLRDNGLTRDLAVPGDIRFTLDGVEHSLDAFDDDGTLLLVFGDRTNGRDSYGGGRFLKVTRGAAEDTVVLDFNRAFVPPCGFSGQYNCPLPPRQNRFDRAIEAGERFPVFRDGFQVH
ncbi:DUF1684 domain-containing protein [Dactylosporangium sp. CA-092794]|uniref:DUF1684 domain-containing protein n=1 Tax=Dactylosporangium sp. CA-092794 TaxID=3239929 RepID=UPI003D8CF286